MNAPTQLDPIIHAPTRLRIMATLATLADGDSISFSRLQQVLDLTSGNLISHLRKLADADYVTMTTTHDDTTKTTEIELTGAGRHAYQQYRATLRDWLDGS